MCIRDSVNAVNPLLEPWQIARILKAANTKVLVTVSPAVSEEIWSKVAAVRDELPALKTVLTLGGAADGSMDLHAALAGQPGDRLISGRVIAPGDIAAYFHTGGTTGTPKLAQHTHGMQAMQIWSTGVSLGLGPDDTIMAGPVSYTHLTLPTKRIV